MPPGRQLNIPAVKGVVMFVAAWTLSLGSALSGIGAQVAAAPAIDFLLGFREERNRGTSMLFALAAAASAVAAAAFGGIAVPWSVVILVLLGATLGAVAAARASQRPAMLLPQRAGQSLGILLAIFMLGVGLRHRIGGPVALDLGELSRHAGLLSFLLGLATGAASQLLQVAAGVFLVPALIFLTGAPAPGAMTVSLAVIALAAVQPVVVYARSQAIDRRIGAWMAAGGVLGGSVGGWLLSRMTYDSQLPFTLFGLIAMFLCAWRIWKMT